MTRLTYIVGSALLVGIVLLLPAGVWAQQENNWTDPGQWQTASAALPQQLTDVMSVVSGTYVYAIGGLNDSVSPVDTVYYAKIDGSGGLGTWQTGTPLPVPVGYTESAATYDGYIYIFGGWNGETNRTSGTVYIAKLSSDGSVGVWTTGTSLPGALSDTTVQVYNGHAYVIGGMPDRESDSGVVYDAKLNTDGKGSVGPWATTTSTTLASDADRSSAASGGYLYVFGGRDANANVTASVYAAKVNSNGSVGQWTARTNPLPQAEYNTSAVVHNGYAYVIGGMDSAGNNGSAIYHAKLNTDGKGSIGPWTTAPGALPQGENGAGSVIEDGTIYVIGGWSDAGQGLESTAYNVPAMTTVAQKSKHSKTNATPQSLLLVDGIAAALACIVLGMTLVMKRQARKTDTKK